MPLTSPGCCWPAMVGQCQHLLQHQSGDSKPLGSLEVAARSPHWLGWDHSGRVWPSPGHPPGPLCPLRPLPFHFFGPLQQPGCCISNKKRPVSEQGIKQDTKTCIPAPSPSPNTLASSPCYWSWQYIRCPLEERHPRFSSWFPISLLSHIYSSTSPSPQQAAVRVMPVSVETSYFPLDNGATSINPSPLYPNCRAEEWNFLWRGINYSPLSNIGNQTIQLIASLTLCASLHDLSGYGSGICKFYLFCSIFTIPETDHLLASFKLLHSFTLWIATDPSMLNPRLAASV